MGLAAGAAWAQPAATQLPAFEVASIKIAGDPGRIPMFCLTPCSPGERLTVTGSRVDIKFMSLEHLIITAFRLKPYQLSGPDWMRAQRFDISAKLPDGVSKDQIPEMLQSLLAERFKLTIHRDNKELPVYALLVGKGGAKLKEAGPEADALAPEASGGSPLYSSSGEARMEGDHKVVVAAGPQGPMRANMGPDGTMHVDLLKVTMAGLADLVTPHVDRPVVDQTGLKGGYQLVWEIVPPPPPEGGGGGGRKSAGPPDGGRGGPPPEGAGEHIDFLATALFKTLDKAGLKIEKSKAPVEMIVVDHLEKTPTEN